MDMEYRQKADRLIEKNRLNIVSKDAEYAIHIRSVDAFLRHRYKRAYELARSARKAYHSHDTLRVAIP